MKYQKQKTYKFTAGDRYHLDQVYSLLGIIPNDTYEQDDMSLYRYDNGNDCGESVKFLKNVKIKIIMEIT